jgi:chromosomal replication initiator protein
VDKPTGAPARDAQAIWSQVADRARDELPEHSYNMWFSEVRARALHDGTLELEAPSEYVRGWLSKNYLKLISRLVAQAAGEGLTVDLRAGSPPEPGPNQDPGGSDALPDVVPDTIGEPEPAAADGTVERYTFETFVLGPSNRFAHAAAMAVAEAAPSKAYNPQLI